MVMPYPGTFKTCILLLPVESMLSFIGKLQVPIFIDVMLLAPSLNGKLEASLSL